MITVVLCSIDFNRTYVYVYMSVICVYIADVCWFVGPPINQRNIVKDTRKAS